MYCCSSRHGWVLWYMVERDSTSFIVSLLRGVNLKREEYAPLFFPSRVGPISEGLCLPGKLAESHKKLSLYVQTTKNHGCVLIRVNDGSETIYFHS